MEASKRFDPTGWVLWVWVSSREHGLKQWVSVSGRGSFFKIPDSYIRV